MFSVVIPTYNRRAQILDAINSAIIFFQNYKNEIIIVDDCSSDQTYEVLMNTYQESIKRQVIRLIRNPQNRGVNFSRAVGISNAKGSHVVLLDSDDELLPPNRDKFFEEIKKYSEAPLYFFRCINESGLVVGSQFVETYKLDLTEYIDTSSSGEVLIVINKNIIDEVPYDFDLLGCEGLAYTRIIYEHGPAINSRYVMRLYKQNGENRLSSQRNFLNRLDHIAQGHSRMLNEFHKFMSLGKKINLSFKIILFKVIYKFWRLILN